MKETKHLRVFHPDRDRADLLAAAAILKNGGTVVIPTETVYGLAADAYNPKAVEAIFAAKGRPADNPLIVHIGQLSQLGELVSRLPEEVDKLATRFWPGPLTVVLPKSLSVPDVTSGGLATVAVRMPEHPVASAIIREAGVPLAAPSANRSGRPSPTTFAHCREDMWGRVDAIVESGDCRVGVESTVLSLCGPVPAILRPGAVTKEQLEEVLGRVDLDPHVLEHLGEEETAHSPGMKYTHYSPLAQVILVEGEPRQYADFLKSEMGAGDWAMCFDEDSPHIKERWISYGPREDFDSQGRRLFDTLRELDRRGAERIFAHAPSPRGVGLAVYNRLIRAAGFQVVRLGPAGQGGEG